MIGNFMGKKFWWYTKCKKKYMGTSDPTKE